MIQDSHNQFLEKRLPPRFYDMQRFLYKQDLENGAFYVQLNLHQ